MKRYRDPRNKSLMKMFNLISIGERSGSGVPNIFNTWADEGWKEPVIEERFDPDRTILTLEFVEKQAKKISEEKRAIILRRYMNILHNMVKVKQMILLHILV
jgi:predicted HTH transcriptional regulator